MSSGTRNCDYPQLRVFYFTGLGELTKLELYEKVEIDFTADAES